MAPNLSQIPAGKAPPGISEHEYHSSFNGIALTAVLSVLTAIAFTFFVLRIYTRVFLVKKPGWDDFTCALGLCGTIADVTCVGIASIDGPLGKHMWNISLADYYGDNFVVTAYILQTTASLTLGLIKLTIFLFYLELFWPLRWCCWTVYIGASLTSAFYLSMTVAQFYFMTPRPGQTIGEHFGTKLVARVTHLSIPTSSVGLVIDVVLFIIPLCAVIQLKMVKRKKVRLVLLFSTGIMAVLGSLLSLAFKLKTYGNPDLTYHLTLVNFFLAVEMTLGICIASLPLAARAAVQHYPKLLSIAHGLSLTMHSLIRRRTSADGDMQSATRTDSGGTPADPSMEHIVEMSKTDSATLAAASPIRDLEQEDC